MGLIQRIFGGKAEAERAQERAVLALAAARQRTPEIVSMTGRIQRHGYVNHLGERVELAWRGGS